MVNIDDLERSGLHVNTEKDGGNTHSHHGLPLITIPLGAESRKTKILVNDVLETEMVINQLKSRIDSWNTASSLTLSTLDAFDAKLALLEETVLPIQRATQRLDKVRRNLDSGLSRLADVLEYIELPAKLEAVIARGPQEDNLDEYFKTIRLLRDALDALSKSKNKASESAAAALTESLNGCVSQLQSLFRRSLAVFSTPINPLNLALDGMPEIPDLITLKEVTTELARLSEFKPAALKEAIAAYQSSRSYYLTNSLAHARNPADQIIGQINKSKVAPSGNQPTLPLTTSSPDNSAPSGKVSQKQASDIFDTYATSLFKMFHVETQIASELFMVTDTIRSTLQDTVATSTSQFIDTFGSIFTATSLDQGTNIVILNAIKCVSRLENEYSSSVMVLCGVPAKRLSEKRKEMMENFGKKLYDLIDYLKVVDKDNAKSSGGSLSSDGTVQEISSRTLTVLKNLSAHTDVVNEVVKNTSHLAGKDFSWVCTEVISALQDNVNHRAHLNKKQSLNLIFLLNNHYYIQKECNSPSLAPYITSQLQDKLEAEWSKTRDSYRDMLTKIIEIVIDTPPIVPINTPSKSVTKNQKEAIKDRFKTFNDTFEELVDQYRNYSVPDPDLHSLIINDITSTLIPLYKIFYERYNPVDFTKNREKYIKYTVPAMENVIKFILK